jgi:hypothetical protein
VHLSREAYMDAASAIVEIASGSGNTGLGDSASSAGTLDSLKRKQPDLVVTLPFQPPKRKLREDCVGAGWMRGEEDRRRGRGRGGPPTAWGTGPRGRELDCALAMDRDAVGADVATEAGLGAPGREKSKKN